MIRDSNFQSPFHRGSGCNPGRHICSRLISLAFSPLFIGVAVVTDLQSLELRHQRSFQSPFHRGSGCNLNQRVIPSFSKYFQSPFHRGSGCNAGEFLHTDGTIAFSPLFIGVAVVTRQKPSVKQLRPLSVPFSSG